MKKINCTLLIDDDEINNFINETIIKRLNITEEIVKVKNGIEGLQYLATFKEPEKCPELILLDLYMPVIDGFDFLASFNKLEFLNKQDVKIIVLSSSHNPKDKERLKKEFGVTNYLIKPLLEEHIYSILGVETTAG